MNYDVKAKMVNPENTVLFEKQDMVNATAIFVGQRLDLKTFDRVENLSNAPLTVAAGQRGVAVMFRYGVVVFFGMRSSEVISFLEDIESLIIEPFPEQESDSIELLLTDSQNEGVGSAGIRLQEFNLQRVQIVADVMAKSVVLGHYELAVARSFDQIEPLAASLVHKKRATRNDKQLLKYIGEALLIESKMTGRVEVSEKPELIWDYPEYERLYTRLEDEYELSERHEAIDRKLSLISRTAETLLELLQNKRSLRVEWYIVILIVIEIFLTLGEKLSS